MLKIDPTYEDHKEEETVELIVKVFGDDCTGLDRLRDGMLEELLWCNEFISRTRVRETIDQSPALCTPLLNKLAAHLQESWDALKVTQLELSNTREGLKRKRSDLEDKERNLQKKSSNFTEETQRVHRLMSILRDHEKALPEQGRQTLRPEQMARDWNTWRNRNRP